MRSRLNRWRSRKAPSRALHAGEVSWARKGPKEEDGDTRYAGHTEFKYKFTWTRTGNEVHKDTVTWTLFVDLPNWTPPASASQADKDAWNRLLQELRKHEQGHVDRYNQGMTKVQAAEV